MLIVATAVAPEISKHCVGLARSCHAVDKNCRVVAFEGILNRIDHCVAEHLLVIDVLREYFLVVVELLDFAGRVVRRNDFHFIGGVDFDGVVVRVEIETGFDAQVYLEVFLRDDGSGGGPAFVHPFDCGQFAHDR